MFDLIMQDEFIIYLGSMAALIACIMGFWLYRMERGEKAARARTAEFIRSLNEARRRQGDEAYQATMERHRKLMEEHNG